MGAWGIKALESDCGLDVVDALTDFVAEQQEEKVHLSLSQIIDLLKGDLLGESFEEINFLYDNTAMALAELYLDFQKNGSLDYGHEDPRQDLSKRVVSFDADGDAVKFLLRYLTDIRDEVPDQDGERESVELWRDSDVFEDWQRHLAGLISQLQALL